MVDAPPVIEKESRFLSDVNSKNKPGLPSTPKSRRLPLSLVVFRTPQEIEGCQARVKVVYSGESIYGHPELICPQIFLDPELRCVVIGDSLYPFDGSMVERVVRAKAAKS